MDKALIIAVCVVVVLLPWSDRIAGWIERNILADGYEDDEGFHYGEPKR